VLAANKLSTEMVVKNTDSKPFSFTTALHSYFRVSWICFFLILWCHQD
jgi:glucose-6-phosphate 1-epimerase